MEQILDPDDRVMRLQTGRQMAVTRRTIVIGGGILAVAVAAVSIWASQRDESAVLGTKVERCKTAEGTSVGGTHNLQAENAPLTVVVSGGRITSVLAPAVKIEPGSPADPHWASFTIGRPEASGGKLTAEIAIRNLLDCSTRLANGRVVAKRGGADSFSTPVTFGSTDSVVVSPGQQVIGRFSAALAGDGTYEISVSTRAEIGLVR